MYNALMTHYVDVGKIKIFPRRSRALPVCKRTTSPSSCGKLKLPGRWEVCGVHCAVSSLLVDLPLPGGRKTVRQWEIFTEDKAAVMIHLCVS